jgi:predicted branched-subunit amino acid permease
MLPLLVGYVPFAFVVGVTIARSSSPPAAWSGVWLIFGGSAHLTVVQLMDAGSSVPAAVAVCAVINIRLAAFSATLARYWRGTSLRSRLLAALTMIDPTWMVTRRRFDDAAPAAEVRDFYLGASLVLWFGWAGLVSGGAWMGNVVPDGLGLEVLAPSCLVAMVVPAAVTAPGLARLLAASAVAVAAASGLPAGFGPLLAMPSGVIAAVVVQRSRRQRQKGARR